MTPVQTGQLYAETDAKAALWEVVQVISPPSGLAHVRLRERASRRRMLLSCRALLERFRLHTVTPAAATDRPALQPILTVEGFPVPMPPAPPVHDEATRREVA